MQVHLFQRGDILFLPHCRVVSSLHRLFLPLRLLPLALPCAANHVILIGVRPYSRTAFFSSSFGPGFKYARPDARSFSLSAAAIRARSLPYCAACSLRILRISSTIRSLIICCFSRLLRQTEIADNGRFNIHGQLHRFNHSVGLSFLFGFFRSLFLVPPTISYSEESDPEIPLMTDRTCTA